MNRIANILEKEEINIHIKYNYINLTTHNRKYIQTLPRKFLSNSQGRF